MRDDVGGDGKAPAHIVTSLWGGHPSWAQCRLVDRRGVSTIRHVRNLLKAVGPDDVVVLNGALGWAYRYVDVLAALCLRLRRRRPWVILTDCTWEPGSRALARKAPWLAGIVPLVSRAVVRALDHDRAIFCVLSSDEARSFGPLWRLRHGKVAHTPFCVTLYDWLDAPVRDEGYVFAGGNSLRDYPLLLSAMEGVDAPLRIASSFAAPNLPAHVLCRPLSHADFMDELLGSRVVVTPLQVSQRSAGQQTYLNAMALGKPVIVTEAPGVRDHIEDGRTGLIVANRPEALREAIRWVLDDANAVAVAAMARAGREEARARFSDRSYYENLLEIARGCLARRD